MYLLLARRAKSFSKCLGRIKGSSGKCYSTADVRCLIFCGLNLLQLIIWFPNILPQIAIVLSHHLSFCLLLLKCGQCCSSSTHQLLSPASPKSNFIVQIYFMTCKKVTWLCWLKRLFPLYSLVYFGYRWAGNHFIIVRKIIHLVPQMAFFQI